MSKIVEYKTKDDGQAFLKCEQVTDTKDGSVTAVGITSWGEDQNVRNALPTQDMFLRKEHVIRVMDR